MQKDNAHNTETSDETRGDVRSNRHFSPEKTSKPDKNAKSDRHEPDKPIKHDKPEKPIRHEKHVKSERHDKPHERHERHLLKEAKVKQKKQHVRDVAKLELLVTVVDRHKGEFYVDLIQSFEVNMQMMCFGRGTAKAEMLRYLGFADSEKTVIFSVIRSDKISDVLASLEEKFETVKNGKGIAFTVPMSSIIGVATYGFLSNNRSIIKEGL